MAKVTLTGNLRLYTAGITEVEIEASRRAFLMGNALVVGVIDRISRELGKRL